MEEVEEVEEEGLKEGKEGLKEGKEVEEMTS